MNPDGGRRQFLGAAATLAAVGSVGCISDGGDGGDGGNGGNGGDDGNGDGGSPTATGTATTTVTAGPTPRTHTVEMNDQLQFVPETVEVAPGDTVVWENVGSVGHSVTAYGDDIPESADYWAAGGFDSEEAARDAYEFGGSIDTGNVPGGESWSHTFQTEGTHECFCIPHESAGMVAEVEVTPDAREEESCTGTTAGSPTDTGTETPAPSESDIDAWLSDTGNYDGSIVDRRGRDEVTIEVGASGNGGNYAFGPPAVRIDPGTAVVWEWTGKGQSHNVHAMEGASFKSETTGQEGFTYSRPTRRASSPTSVTPTSRSA